MAAAAIGGVNGSASGGVQEQRAQGAAVLDLRVSELRQIFDAMDPAPFRERDLDPKAAAYIVGWAEETPKEQPLALVVHLGAPRPGQWTGAAAVGGGEPGGGAPLPEAQPSATAGDAALLGEAVREFFRGEAAGRRRDLAQLFRTGRISLAIGLAFLAGTVAAAEILDGLIAQYSWAGLVKESLVIGGWVALWRPMEIFLYDWWPIRARARLYDRLGAIQVSLRAAGAAPVQAA